MNVDVLWSNFLEQIKDELSPVLFVSIGKLPTTVTI